MKIKSWNFKICNFANLWHPADTFRLIILVIFIICSWNHSKKKSNTVIFYFNKAFFLDSQSHTNFYQSTWATTNEFIIWYYLILKQLWVVYGTLSFYNWKHSDIVVATTTGVEISDCKNIRSVSSTLSKIWYFCKNS